ncbi:MAG: ethylbenzene dehydrogenase-related protein [Chitinophagaceae bacterium]|jgi:hypothetical protein|nr:ethylbenzene dehydrogenase-related protein [Chitinophagaceae bacterium]
MKNRKKIFVVSTVALTVFVLLNCTKSNQILGTSPSTADTSSTLRAVYASTAPTIDGTIDAAWNSATPLHVTAVVPDPGNNLWPGWVGTSHNVTMQAMYDSSNVYFLVQWEDATNTINLTPWYYTPSSNAFTTSNLVWAHEANSITWNSNGIQVKPAYGEDKFGMAFNIDNSTTGFATQTCYAACHTTVTVDTASTLKTGGNMSTTAQNAKLDLWEMRVMSDQAAEFASEGQSGGYAKDCFIDWANGQPNTLDNNGRHNDFDASGTNTAAWPANNSQSLARKFDLSASPIKVTVPKYVPNPNGSAPAQRKYIWFADTTGAAAGTGKYVLVTAVDTSGNLYYNNGGVQTVIPASSYPVESNLSVTYANQIPYEILFPPTGSLADIHCVAVYTGSGYVAEFKRARKTGDTVNQDVDFSNRQDQPFGIAVFDNGGNNHAIVTNLLLHFQ